MNKEDKMLLAIHRHLLWQKETIGIPYPIPPRIRELMQIRNISSTSVASYYVNKLKDKGLLWIREDFPLIEASTRIPIVITQEGVKRAIELEEILEEINKTNKGNK